MLYKNRYKFRSKSSAIGKFFSKAPLSANHWTVLSIILALISSYLIYEKSFLAAAMIFAVASLADVIDGAVARDRGTSSPKGGHLDNVSDRYVEFIIIAGLMLVDFQLYYNGFGTKLYIDMKFWLLLLLFGSMMTTYAKASAAEQMKISVKGGILERGERLILLFISLATASFSIYAAAIVLIIAAVLANVTALQRIVYALKNHTEPVK